MLVRIECVDVQIESRCVNGRAVLESVNVAPATELHVRSREEGGVEAEGVLLRIACAGNLFDVLLASSLLIPDVDFSRRSALARCITIRRQDETYAKLEPERARLGSVVISPLWNVQAISVTSSKPPFWRALVGSVAAVVVVVISVVVVDSAAVVVSEVVARPVVCFVVVVSAEVVPAVAAVSAVVV